MIFSKTLKLSLVLGLTLHFTYDSFAQQINESDLKTDVLNIEAPVQKLMLLEPIVYRYNTEKYPKLKLSEAQQFGFSLQSAASATPSLIKTHYKSFSNGKNSLGTARYRELDAEKLIPVMVAAIQEQQQTIESLKKEIALLKKAKE
ncbi:hypothetical protein BCY91_14250 [Pelobium manganitolerans]|uniref:Peptidase S74 domain-containing protein n=1 Tax=Pelobium manganitolerans TaxID=1842495 RepID=A0A419SA01_9SPHI|nr:tail fiber domain-containing protein [Pelobium manganitolerans]RKD19033.1 hypothetical protein BCY91_14250 [Pelobium manganitolerans]